MTSGVKILLRPRTSRGEGAFWSGVGGHKDQLSLARLEVVVVVELLAAHELLELGRRAEPVDAELALDQLGVGLGPLAFDAVDAQRGDLAADVDRAVVHRVAQTVAHVAADDLPAALHHEAGHRPGVAEHEDRAALLVDPRPRAHLALDDEVASAQRGAGERAGVALDDDDARHHVLGHRPAHSPVDLDLGPIDQADPEVAEAPLEGDAAAGQDPGAERMTGARIEDRHVLDALLVEQPAQLGVDLARGQLARVEHGALAVDLGDLRDRAVELDEPAGVVGRAQVVHTITAPS